VFTVTDPQGNRITLTDECWYDHICVVHTEMRGLLDQVRLTLTDPDCIYTSKSSPNSHLYFRQYVDPRLKCAYVLTVVYRKDEAARGYVQSAYPVKTLSKGGRLKWKKQ
jgi:hypothetical protein